MKTMVKTHVIYEDGIVTVDVFKVDGYMREVNVFTEGDNVTLYDKASIKTLHDLLGKVLDREFDSDYGQIR